MIEINNLTAIAVDEKFLKGLAKKVLKGENRKEMDLSVVFVSKDKIRELNKKYRKQDKPTDVLSFGEGLNEIVICFGVVKKNAKKYKITFKQELSRVLIHGILHLLGYEHEKDEAEAREMKEREDCYLSQL